MKGKTILAGAAAAAVVGARRRVTTDIPPSLDVEPVQIPVATDRTVVVYTAGPEGGRPLLLVHSVNAAASAAEMRPLFERLQIDRRVAALDLPGYGRSTRPRIGYTPEIMTGGIVAVLRHLGQPADLVALSLGCEFAARAAIDEPELVATLTLISPTGFQTNQDRPDAGWLGGTLRSPLGEALYRALVSRRSIEFFLAKSFEGEVDPQLVEAGLAASRHPDARFAPASFLSGALFTSRAIDRLYDKVTQPVLVIADRDTYSSFERLPEMLDRHPHWRHERLAPHRGLPQFDRPDETARTILEFTRT